MTSILIQVQTTGLRWEETPKKKYICLDGKLHAAMLAYQIAAATGAEVRLTEPNNDNGRYFAPHNAEAFFQELKTVKNF